MKEFQVFTAAEQVSAYLAHQIACGVWTGTMPGAERLARTLGVGRMTLEAALVRLEEDGVLLSRGGGRRREIIVPESLETLPLRVGILLYAPDDLKLYYNVDLQHRLLNAGHNAGFSKKTLVEFKMDPSRVAREVKKVSADAWIVSSASHEVLEWFAESEVPAFAFAGRRHRVSRLASVGPQKEPVMRELIPRLMALGHRRIVMIARAVCRNPVLGKFEQAFKDELEAHGIDFGSYHLPDWEESAEGLVNVLDSLFQHTPPTALIIGEAHTFIAVEKHLARKGIFSPRDVSLICDDSDPVFSWCRPAVSHIDWDGYEFPRRAVRWAANVANGKDDFRLGYIKARFVDGETIGPAST